MLTLLLLLPLPVTGVINQSFEQIMQFLNNTYYLKIRFDGRSLKCQFACAYNRIIINGKCFSSALYSADFKRDNELSD